MARPRLTFACELDAARLTDLFANGWKVGTTQRSLAWDGVHPWHVLGAAATAAWIVRRWRTARR